MIVPPNYHIFLKKNNEEKTNKGIYTPANRNNDLYHEVTSIGALVELYTGKDKDGNLINIKIGDSVLLEGDFPVFKIDDKEMIAVTSSYIIAIDVK